MAVICYVSARNQTWVTCKSKQVLLMADPVLQPLINMLWYINHSTSLTLTLFFFQKERSKSWWFCLLFQYLESNGRRSGTQGHLEANLGYLRTYLKTPSNKIYILRGNASAIKRSLVKLGTEMSLTANSLTFYFMIIISYIVGSAVQNFSCSRRLSCSVSLKATFMGVTGLSQVG